MLGPQAGEGVQAIRWHTCTSCRKDGRAACSVAWIFTMVRSAAPASQGAGRARLAFKIFTVSI